MDRHAICDIFIRGYSLLSLTRRDTPRTKGRVDKNIFSGIHRMDDDYGYLPARILRLDCSRCRYIEEGLYTFSGDNSHYGRQGWNKFCDLASRHDPDTHEELKKFSHEGNGAPSGTFAGTLTKAPDWEETEDDMVYAICKIMEQQTCPVEKYIWYVEYTDNGLPHIHFIYRTVSGGRIHAKVFKRYWKQWDEKRKLGHGHQGGYHKHVQSETAYKEYISKDSGRSGSKWSQEKSPA